MSPMGEAVDEVAARASRGCGSAGTRRRGTSCQGGILAGERLLDRGERRRAADAPLAAPRAAPRGSSATPSVEMRSGKRLNFLLMSTPISVAPATSSAFGCAARSANSSATRSGRKKRSARPPRSRAPSEISARASASDWKASLRCSSRCASGVGHRVADGAVAGAPAEVAVELVVDRRQGSLTVGAVEPLEHRDHEAGRAEAALRAVALDHRRLHRVQGSRSRVRHALDRDDLPAGDHRQQRDAAVDRAEDCAGRARPSRRARRYRRRSRPRRSPAWFRCGRSIAGNRSSGRFDGPAFDRAGLPFRVNSKDDPIASPHCRSRWFSPTPSQDRGQEASSRESAGFP